MAATKKGSGRFSPFHMPCWWAKRMGRRHGKDKRDGGKWIARQVDTYRRFEIRELEKCKNDQAEVRRKARMLCGNIDQAQRKTGPEEDRLRARDHCERWLAQLADMKLVLDSREETSVYRCMHEDNLRRALIRAYLEEYERHMPQISYADGYRVGDPLYSGESRAWKVYEDHVRPLREDMEEKLTMKGVK